jgi:hypothetical protein
VRGLADKHQPAVADSLRQRSQVDAFDLLKRLGRLAKQLGNDRWG